MKIKELIEKLEEFDWETDVFIKANWTEEAEIIQDNTFIWNSIIIY